MKHDSALRLKHAAEALALLGSELESLSSIWARQEKPRLSRSALLDTIIEKVWRGELEKVNAGRWHFYRRPHQSASRHLATRLETPYTSHQRIEYSLDANVDWLTMALAPLRSGKPVLLWMDDPKLKARKKLKGDARRLVLFSPGALFSPRRTLVFVSVVGAGCCAINVVPPAKIANLVLAGVPAALAKPLMNSLYHVLKE